MYVERMRFRTVFALATASALALPLAACSAKKPAGLMLAIQTDLSATKDIDELGVFVLADGRPLLAQSYPIGPGVHVPSTVAIAAPANPPSSVRVRVVGFKSGSARILREGTTTVPTERLAVLSLPLRWIDDGSGIGSELDFQLNPYASARAKCPEGKTADLGNCVDAIVPEAKLPEYDPAEIFGGGAEGAGSCFPTAACFVGSTPATVDEAKCTIPAPPSTTRFNVGVVTTNGDGEASAADSIIVLDEATEWTASGGAIQLPKALCAPPVRARWKALTTTTRCETKRLRYPICGSFATGTPLPAN